MYATLNQPEQDGHAGAVSKVTEGQEARFVSFPSTWEQFIIKRKK